MYQMGVFVTKADGSRQLFDGKKVIRTCLRMGASEDIAYAVAKNVERRLYDGIPTKQILQMIFRYMRKYKPGVGHLFDLRKGLSLMSSKPEFELFVQILLANYGFEVSPNRILRGKCVGHEIDAIAKKNGITYFVEAKHHSSYHALTGLDESRIARAVLEDVTEGYALGDTDLKIDHAMIVTNTRYSDHAIKYGKCRDILQIGWSSPENLSLQKIIEEKKVYPLSCLRGLKYDARLKLVNSGIILIRQLLNEDPLVIERKTGLPRDFIRDLIEKAKSIANTLGFS